MYYWIIPKNCGGDLGSHMYRCKFLLPTTHYKFICNTQLYSSVVDLTGRWKALVANAQALINWAEQMREKLSEAIADKDNCGVEDHLAICEVRPAALVCFTTDDNLNCTVQ